MADEFKKGDHVQWESSGGTSKSKVVRKLTEPMDIHDFHVAASPATSSRASHPASKRRTNQRRSRA